MSFAQSPSVTISQVTRKPNVAWKEENQNIWREPRIPTPSHSCTQVSGWLSGGFFLHMIEAARVVSAMVWMCPPKDVCGRLIPAQQCWGHGPHTVTGPWGPLSGCGPLPRRHPWWPPCLWCALLFSHEMTRSDGPHQLWPLPWSCRSWDSVHVFSCRRGQDLQMGGKIVTWNQKTNKSLFVCLFNFYYYWCWETKSGALHHWAGSSEVLF